MLMSLTQMRNLRFHIGLSPEGAYLSSKAFGANNMKLQFSTTRHLVVDLAAIQWVNPEETKLTECPDPNLRFPSYHSKPVHESAGAERTASAHVEIGGQWKEVFPDAEADDVSRAVAPPASRLEEPVAVPHTPEPAGLWPCRRDRSLKSQLLVMRRYLCLQNHSCRQAC